MEEEKYPMTTSWTQCILLYTTPEYFTITVTNGLIRNLPKNLGELPGTLPGGTAQIQEEKNVSTRSGGYHGAKTLRETGEDTQDDLINLATAAEVDRDTMMTQSTTIADLTATIANLIQQLQQATVRINTLKIPREPETPTNRPPKWVDGKHIRDAGWHCWTHGYCVDLNHNSMA